MSKFEQLYTEYLPKLELYTTTITKVHGKNHPEVFQVHDLFVEMTNKNNAGENLTSYFKQLREITRDYEIPDDVCETFEGTYQMISELDAAYSVEV